MNAIAIDEKDNVAVVLGDTAQGEEVIWSASGSCHKVCAVEQIPMYHKIAIKEIAQGEAVIKYGERIGVATQKIPAGAHVHTHNVQSAGESGRG